MASASAFYVRDGERIVATEATRGPWSDAHQHGGPPAALLGRAVEELAGDDWVVARATVELLRPVPIGPVEVEAAAERVGRQVARFRARLRVAGVKVFTALFLAVRRSEVTLPDHLPTASGDPPPGPDASEPFTLPFFVADVGYHTSVELRVARGRWGEGGPVAAWLRPRVALVEGEPVTPLQRVLITCDAGSGVGANLDTRRYSFVNPDLSLHLHRPLRGEWVGLSAWLAPQRTGVGQCDTTVFDPDGPIGRAVQSLVVAER